MSIRLNFQILLFALFSAALWLYNGSFGFLGGGNFLTPQSVALPLFLLIAKNLLLWHLLILLPYFLRDLYFTNYTAMPQFLRLDPKLFTRLLVSSYLAAFALVLPAFASPLLRYLPGLLALPFVYFSAIITGKSFQQLLFNGQRPLSEYFTFFAFVFFGGGVLWLYASLLPHNFLGFAEPLKTLTAVHFLYGGHALMMSMGKTAKALRQYHPYYDDSGSKKLMTLLSFIYPLAFFLVAVGIAITNITQNRLLEKIAGSVLVASTLLLLMVWIKFSMRRLIIRYAFLLNLAMVGLCVAMGLALAYALRVSLWGWGVGAFDFTLMALAHGLTNVFAVVGASYLFFTITENFPNQGSLNVFRKNLTFSKISANFFVDARSMLERHQDPNRHAQGLIDSKNDLGLKNLHPDIAHFYLHTKEAQIQVNAQWQNGFGVLKKIYQFFSKRIGQFDFPDGSAQSQQMFSNIIAINDQHDGRTSVRAWHRTYPNQKTAYLAIYSMEQEGQQEAQKNEPKEKDTFMNIAFPFFFGNMTSSLRIEHYAKDIIALTTDSKDDIGHEGIYMRWKFLTWRLPLNETIYVGPQEAFENNEEFSSGAYPKDDFQSKNKIMARHDMRLFGKTFLTLYYRIGYV